MKLSTIYILSKLPLDLLIVVLRFYIFGGLRFRKFLKSLLNCLKLHVFRTALTVDVMDSKWLGPYTNSFLIRRIVPLAIKPVVKTLPGYGEQYDENSIWLVKQPNRKPSDPVIIFSHGGGYFIQTMPSQIISLAAVYKLLEPGVQRKVSILFLDYKLVSQGFPFPTQLNQLDATYKKLGAEGNTNLILMGDSAGGHLSISYTQFLKQQGRTDYPSKMILVSPWVKLVPLPGDMVKGKSWVDNEEMDMIHHSKFANMNDLRSIVGIEDPYLIVWSPGGKVPRQREDWSDIPTYSSPKHDVFVILGEDESFRDDILQWCKFSLNVPFYEKVKYGNLHEFFEKEDYELERRGDPNNANLSLHIEPLGVHDSMLFFEDRAARQVARNIKAGKASKLADFDSEKYFGITRLAKFLNETV